MLDTRLPKVTTEHAGRTDPGWVCKNPGISCSVRMRGVCLMPNGNTLMFLVRLAMIAAGLALVATPANAALFDNKRQGFVLEAGLGPGLTYGPAVSDSLHWTPKTNFSIWFPRFWAGGALSGRLAIYGMWQSAIYDLPGIGAGIGRVSRWVFDLPWPLDWLSASLLLPLASTYIVLTHSHGILAAGTTYYPRGYIECGIGRTPHRAGPALGLAAGAGYEFARRRSLDLNLMYSPVIWYSGTGQPNLFSVGLTLNFAAY